MKPNVNVVTVAIPEVLIKATIAKSLKTVAEEFRLPMLIKPGVKKGDLYKRRLKARIEENLGEVLFQLLEKETDLTKFYLDTMNAGADIYNGKG